MVDELSKAFSIDDSGLLGIATKTSALIKIQEFINGVSSEHKEYCTGDLSMINTKLISINDSSRNGISVKQIDELLGYAIYELPKR